MTKLAYFPRLGSYGRLGNQMFQIAALHSLLMKCKLDGIAFHWNYSSPSGPLQERCYIDLLYPAFSRINRIDEIDDSFQISGIFLEQNDFTEGLRVFQEWNNRELCDSTEHSNLCNNRLYVIHGYFQSEEYFGDITLDMFNERSKQLNEAIDIARTYLNSLGFSANDSVAVHVRRGDYRNILDVLPTLPADYYYSALSSKDKNVFVFGDYADAELSNWINETFSEKNLGFQIKKVDSRQVSWLSSIERPIQDAAWMHVFGDFNKAVIANSSFSWWGARLGEHRGTVKNVFAPRNWFGPAGPSPHRIVPERWYRI
jgi:hypothetical protein